MLLKFNLIKEIKIENNRVYSEASLNKSDIERGYYLSNEKVLSILKYFNNNSIKGYTKSELSSDLNMNLNTVTKYLNKLEKLDIIQKKIIADKILYFKEKY